MDWLCSMTFFLWFFPGAKGFMSFVHEEVNLSRVQITAEQFQECSRLFEIEKSRQRGSYNLYKHLLHSCVVGDEPMCRYLILHQGADHMRSVTENDLKDKLTSSSFQCGDTPLSVALRFENASIARLLTSLPNKPLQKGTADVLGDNLTSLLTSFGSYYSRHWHKSAVQYDADSPSLLEELRKKFKWVSLFRRADTNVGKSIHSMADVMLSIPFYLPPQSCEELQKIGISLLEKENAKEIANHFLIWTFQMFSRLSPSDLASYPLSSVADDVAPQLSLFSNFLNDIHRWVEVLVLSDWDAKDRGKTIEFFISLADALQHTRCYLASIGVTFGLQSVHISRFGRVEISIFVLFFKTSLQAAVLVDFGQSRSNDYF
jgi:hypothetical protein